MLCISLLLLGCLRWFWALWRSHSRHELKGTPEGTPEGYPEGYPAGREQLLGTDDAGRSNDAVSSPSCSRRAGSSRQETAHSTPSPRCSNGTLDAPVAVTTAAAGVPTPRGESSMDDEAMAHYFAEHAAWNGAQLTGWRRIRRGGTLVVAPPTPKKGMRMEDSPEGELRGEQSHLQSAPSWAPGAAARNSDEAEEMTPPAGVGANDLSKRERRELHLEASPDSVVAPLLATPLVPPTPLSPTSPLQDREGALPTTTIFDSQPLSPSPREQQQPPLSRPPLSPLPSPDYLSFRRRTARLQAFGLPPPAMLPQPRSMVECASSRSVPYSSPLRPSPRPSPRPSGWFDEAAAAAAASVAAEGSYSQGKKASDSSEGARCSSKCAESRAALVRWREAKHDADRAARADEAKAIAGAIMRCAQPSCSSPQLMSTLVSCFPMPSTSCESASEGAMERAPDSKQPDAHPCQRQSDQRQLDQAQQLELLKFISHRMRVEAFAAEYESARSSQRSSQHSSLRSSQRSPELAASDSSPCAELREGPTLASEDRRVTVRTVEIVAPPTAAEERRARELRFVPHSLRHVVVRPP